MGGQNWRTSVPWRDIGHPTNDPRSATRVSFARVSATNDVLAKTEPSDAHMNSSKMIANMMQHVYSWDCHSSEKRRGDWGDQRSVERRFDDLQPTTFNHFGRSSNPRDLGEPISHGWYQSLQDAWTQIARAHICWYMPSHQDIEPKTTTCGGCG